MKKRIPPLVVIVLSFALIILIGMLLLKLPFAVNDGQYLRWVDSLFLATSAVCVTGLVPIPNIGETLSVFGKIILCLLVQIGGLGFVTIGVFVLTIIGAKIGLSERYLIKEALNQNKATELIKLVKSKRYTYNKLKRMFLHILCSFTKEEAKRCLELQYIRVLGFNDQGRKYLNSIKKECKLPIVSNYDNSFEIMQIENRVCNIYNIKKDDFIEEYKHKPIIF